MPETLPPLYAITAPLTGADPSHPILRQAGCRKWLIAFEKLLASDIRLVQLRAKELSPGHLRDLAWRCDSLASAKGADLLLNGPPEVALELGMSGIHLTSQSLMYMKARPLSEDYIVGASCHSGLELAHAERIGADFACLSPVNPTRGYSDDSVLGLQGFSDLAATCSIPVYALGGMRRSDVEAVIGAGGQGVAGISAFWPE